MLSTMKLMCWTIALPGISRQLAGRADLDAAQVLEVIRTRDGLTDLLMTFGLDVPRWLLVPGTADTRRAGTTGSAVLMRDQDLERMVGAVGTALAEFVPDPVVLVPWSCRPRGNE